MKKKIKEADRSRRCSHTVHRVLGCRNHAAPGTTRVCCSVWCDTYIYIHAYLFIFHQHTFTYTLHTYSHSHTDTFTHMHTYSHVPPFWCSSLLSHPLICFVMPPFALPTRARVCACGWGILGGCGRRCCGHMHGGARRVDCE
jgi:hypothetical protein